MNASHFTFRRSSDHVRRLMHVATVGFCAMLGHELVDDSTARASTITVNATDCQRLVQHRPAADVAYTPGVDANGNAVAPADLPGSVTIETPTEVTFDVSYDLLSNYGIETDTALAPRGEAVVGTVKYDLLSGVLTFNGERLDDGEAAALADLCRAAEAQEPASAD